MWKPIKILKKQMHATGTDDEEMGTALGKKKHG